MIKHGCFNYYVDYRGRYLMNDIIYLLLQLFRERGPLTIALTSILICTIYFNMPSRQSSIECFNGYCKIYNGAKQVNDFAVKDINSCSPSYFRLPCHNRFFGITRGSSCYYPVIRLRNGSTIDLPTRFGSKYKSDINSFCTKIKLNNDFTYRK